MSKSLRLIASLTSPYVRKVRIVMAEKRIDYQIELEDVWSPDTRIHDFNPLGKVPCLIIEDGGAIFDSRAIVEYLDTLTPLHHLIPSDGRERAEVRTWEALGDGLLDAALLVRLEQTQRTAEQRSEPWVARQDRKITDALAAMARDLGERPWCTGNTYSLADIAVGCALGYLDFRFPGRDWRASYANLARLQAKLNARPSFVDTAPPA